MWGNTNKCSKDCPPFLAEGEFKCNIASRMSQHSSLSQIYKNCTETEINMTNTTMFISYSLIPMPKAQFSNALDSCDQDTCKLNHGIVLQIYYMLEAGQ